MAEQEHNSTPKEKGIAEIRERFLQLPESSQNTARIFCNLGLKDVVYNQALEAAGNKALLVTQHGISADDICDMALNAAPHARRAENTAKER